MDIWDSKKRSEVMARIRSRGNAATELRLITVMREHGIKGWRRHQPMLGRPDFTFRHERVLVFVDGCFWHGCPRCYRAPTSNETYWSAKLARNVSRDKRQRAELRRCGWQVMRVWEHQLARDPKAVAIRLMRALRL